MSKYTSLYGTAAKIPGELTAELAIAAFEGTLLLYEDDEKKAEEKQKPVKSSKN